MGVWEKGVMVQEETNRTLVFMMVGMLSIGLLAGACGAACLLALLGGG